MKTNLKIIYLVLVFNLLTLCYLVTAAAVKDINIANWSFFNIKVYIIFSLLTQLTLRISVYPILKNKK